MNNKLQVHSLSNINLMVSDFSTADPCSLNACLNDGTCAADSDWPYFRCSCSSGYIGFNCGTEIGNILQRPWPV